MSSSNGSVRGKRKKDGRDSRICWLSLVLLTAEQVCTVHSRWCSDASSAASMTAGALKACPLKASCTSPTPRCGSEPGVGGPNCRMTLSRSLLRTVDQFVRRRKQINRARAYVINVIYALLAVTLYFSLVNIKSTVAVTPWRRRQY